MVCDEVQLLIMEDKSIGMTLAEVKADLEKKGYPVPGETTLRKYYRRDMEDGILSAAQKEKAFDAEPFRSFIIEVLRNNKSPCASSVYDVLTERFVESGEYEKLPASLRSLQTYIHWLTDSGIVEKTEKEGRIYDHVFDTPPGDELMIDFGDYNLGDRVHFHFLCLLLRYSRWLVVFGQDHKYNSQEACRDIYRCFQKMGGTPERLVIDQDAVFIHSETYGEVIKTEIFERFCSEQKVGLYVCRKADPESKGPIENSVKYVKMNYLSARRNRSIQQLISGLPQWLHRINSRIHRATFCVPEKIFTELEKPSLRPLLPSVYNRSPLAYINAELENYPYIMCRSNKYYYPSDYAFKQVCYRVVDGTVYLYDRDRKPVTSYPVSPLKGRSFQHEGFARKPVKFLETIEHMRKKWDCNDFQHFVNGVKKESKNRYLNERFGYISDFLDEKDPDPRFAARLLKYCCQNFRYTPTQFRASYELLEKSQEIPQELLEKQETVESRSLDEYQAVFEKLAGKQ